jgi:hypothetical protein
MITTATDRARLPGLPAGWKYDRVPESLTCFVISATNDMGHVTLEFGDVRSKRGFRGGLNQTSGPYAEASNRYAGRGWQTSLYFDAIVWLSKAIDVPCSEPSIRCCEANR